MVAKATITIVTALLFVSARAQLDDIVGAIDSVACGTLGKHCSTPPPAVTSSPSTTAPPPLLNPALGNNLTLNQVQIVGTFQSYHQAPPQAIINLLNTAPFQANFVAEQDYDPFAYSFTHPSITQQLENGIRGFEIDTLADPNGGAYAYSAGLKLAGASSTLISPDLLKPGIKAISYPDWDFNSTCYLFTECLSEIQAWSEANPNHFPVVVFIHHGGTTTPQNYLGTQYAALAAELAANTSALPLNFSQGVNAAIPDIISEIESVFTNPSQYYTPDNLRADNGANSSANLRDIVLANGALAGSWPTIERLRGKVLFFADPDYSSAVDAVYPAATGSILWPSDDNGDADPNVVVLDGMVDVQINNLTVTPFLTNPVIASNAEQITYAAAWGVQAMTLQGFWVRAGVDNTLIEAKYNYTLRADIFQSIGGANGVWTFVDQPTPQNLIPSTYQVNPQTQFGGAVAVCSPVTTGTAETMGSVAFPFDGAIPQLGAANVIQPPLPACPLPGGFSS